MLIIEIGKIIFLPLSSFSAKSVTKCLLTFCWVLAVINVTEFNPFGFFSSNS